MHDNTVIFLAITLGFTLLVIVIRFFPFGIFAFRNKPSMYYKLNLAEAKITSITLSALKEDMDNLFDEDYKLIKSAALKAIINHKTPLPQRSFFVAVNESCVRTIIKALPVLKKEQLSIIIFIPTFLVESNNGSQEMQPGLQQFIFHEVLKNKSGDTQLNSATSPL